MTCIAQILTEYYCLMKYSIKGFSKIPASTFMIEPLLDQSIENFVKHV